MQVLLTFTGFHDPYAKGLIGQEEQPGPILSLVSVRAFEHVILFSTPSTIVHTQATKAAIVHCCSLRNTSHACVLGLTCRERGNTCTYSARPATTLCQHRASSSICS